MAYKDYKRLKYLSEQEYKDELKYRSDNAVMLNLDSKNGEQLRFVMTDEVKSLLKEIDNVYKRAEVDQISFIAEEAYSTCTIEGAKSTLPETIKLLEGKKPDTHSEKMIANNIQAIQTVLNNDFEFTEEDVLRLWTVLSNGAVDNVSIQGEKYRLGKVIVADGMGNVYFEAPDYHDIQLMMNRLIDFCNAKTVLNDYVKAIIIHYYFVYIHPFCDGNGRTARLLLQDYLIQAGLEKYKGISISSGVLKNKSMYYKTLQQSENEYNDITFIIIFYLETILDVLYDCCKGFGYGERHLEMSETQKKAVQHLRRHTGEAITIAKYCEAYKINDKIAEKELRELVDNNILDTRLGANFQLEFYIK